MWDNKVFPRFTAVFCCKNGRLFAPEPGRFCFGKDFFVVEFVLAFDFDHQHKVRRFDGEVRFVTAVLFPGDSDLSRIGTKPFFDFRLALQKADEFQLRTGVELQREENRLLMCRRNCICRDNRT